MPIAGKQPTDAKRGKTTNPDAKRGKTYVSEVTTTFCFFCFWWIKNGVQSMYSQFEFSRLKLFL